MESACDLLKWISKRNGLALQSLFFPHTSKIIFPLFHSLWLNSWKSVCVSSANSSPFSSTERKLDTSPEMKAPLPPHTTQGSLGSTTTHAAGKLGFCQSIRPCPPSPCLCGFVSRTPRHVEVFSEVMEQIRCETQEPSKAQSSKFSLELSDQISGWSARAPPLLCALRGLSGAGRN